MKLIKALNKYFFGAEKIHKSDAIWFYGMMTFMCLVLGFLIGINIQLKFL